LLIATELVTEYLRINDEEALLNLLSDFDTLSWTKIILYEWYMRKMDLENASNALEIILSDTLINEQYRTAQSLVFATLFDERELNELESGEMEDLFDLRTGTGSGTDIAKAFFNLNSDGFFELIPEQIPELRTLQIQTQQSSKNELELSNYPNPFESLTTIVINGFSAWEGSLLVIESPSGKLIKTEKITDENFTFELHSENLSPGIYFYSVEDRYGIRIKTKTLGVIK
jgi:hypothetical protein